MDWNRGFQLVEKGSPPVADLGRSGAIDPVADLRDGKRAEDDMDSPTVS
jgi:hypothetical protein